MLENSSTEKVTTRCLYCITSLVLYKQKLSMVLQSNKNKSYRGRSDSLSVSIGVKCNPHTMVYYGQAPNERYGKLFSVRR